MLYIQEISFYYQKDARNANYANVRRAVRFRPVDFDKDELNGVIFYDKVNLYQSSSGIRERKITKCLDERAFYTGKFYNDPFGERIAVKRAEEGYEILYRDNRSSGFMSSKFTLKIGQTGRIVYNYRHVYGFGGIWLYGLHTFNFVCGKEWDFKPKMFFVKEPDFVFNDMKKLRYTGN